MFDITPFLFNCHIFLFKGIIKLGFSSRKCSYTMSVDFFIDADRDGTKIKYFNQNQSRLAYKCYKNLTHRSNYCKPSLSEDIEVNPGPTFTNYSSTNCAPYSQGDVDIFYENAGRQCVAMSLCSLIHVYCQGAIPDSGV